MITTTESCYVCKSEDKLLVQERRKRKDGSVRMVYICRKCNTEKAAKYRQNPKGRAKAFSASLRSQSAHKIETNARQLLNYHLKKGNITRPTCCPSCSKECVVEGHHSDYSKPLEVMWLCRQCHADEHRRIKLTVNNK